MCTDSVRAEVTGEGKELLGAVSVRGHVSICCGAIGESRAQGQQASAAF